MGHRAGPGSSTIRNWQLLWLQLLRWAPASSWYAATCGQLCQDSIAVHEQQQCLRYDVLHPCSHVHGPCKLHFLLSPDLAVVCSAIDPYNQARSAFVTYPFCGSLQAIGQLTYIRPYVTDFSPEWLFTSSLSLVAGALGLIYIAGERLGKMPQTAAAS
eukprot:GHUV01029506.1.p1 GENE.GHUV01029506.1~~GHUV01029506.1.p1  ORF type:complete len:158 (-),score=39.30 GHUV01029506.1:147-620(-)